MMGKGLIKFDKGLPALEINSSIDSYRCSSRFSIGEVVILPDILNCTTVRNNIVVLIGEVPVTAENILKQVWV